jgi:glycosyltransferase involved in cell wall biosynthesis
VIIAHEIGAGWGRNPVHWWYAFNHRVQWRRAMQTADLLPVSTERWLIDWSRWYPPAASRLFLKPSPATILPHPVPPGHREAWRIAHGLPADTRILMWFGTVNGAKQLHWVTTAWAEARRRGLPVALVIVGGTPEVQIPAGAESWYRALGFLEAREVSLAMAAADVLALPFIDGLSERRSSLMVGLAHGVAVVGTHGHSSGPAMRTADFVVVTDADAVDGPAIFARAVADLLSDDARRKALARAGAEAYERRFSWPVVARMMRERMMAAGILP